MTWIVISGAAASMLVIIALTLLANKRAPPTVVSMV